MMHKLNFVVIFKLSTTLKFQDRISISLSLQYIFFNNGSPLSVFFPRAGDRKVDNFKYYSANVVGNCEVHEFEGFFTHTKKEGKKKKGKRKKKH